MPPRASAAPAHSALFAASVAQHHQGRAWPAQTCDGIATYLGFCNPDVIHRFVSVWHAWRNLVVGRLRFRCLVGRHIERLGLLGQRTLDMSAELYFRGWAKVAHAQVGVRPQA